MKNEKLPSCNLFLMCCQNVGAEFGLARLTLTHNKGKPWLAERSRQVGFESLLGRHEQRHFGFFCLESLQQESEKNCTFQGLASPYAREDLRLCFIMLQAEL